MSAPPRWVFFFDDPLPDGVGEARHLLGGKGASLAAMTAAGLNVPPGFTITTECCRRFFEAGGVWPEGLAEQVRANLQRLEQVTGRPFGRGPRPLLVSVRSGAAASMPGMMDTILNCGLHPDLAREVGDTPSFWRVYIQFITMFAKTVAAIDPDVLAPPGGAPDSPPCRTRAEELLRDYERLAGKPFPTDPIRLLNECIDAVFHSWNNERAVAYRKRNDIRGLVGTAVNVQAMWPSRVSGILFTRDPNNISADHMIIESSYGLGEAVVSGDVTPDRFRVRRDGFATVEAVIGQKTHAVAALGDDGPDDDGFDPSAASLADEQLAELRELGLRIEDHYGAPMDIEWGYADGRLAVLQCRPIRGLEIAEDVEAGRQEEIRRLRELAGGRRRVWVAHNLGETLRAPTPLTWDIVRRFMTGSGGFGTMYQDFGYNPAKLVRDEGFLELICGRIYADPQRMAQMFWDGMPMAYDLDAIVADPRLLEAAPSRFDPDRADGRFLLKLPGNVVSMIRSARKLNRLRRTARKRFEEEVLPPYVQYVRSKRGQDLTALSTAQVIAELHDRRRRVLDDFGGESLKPGFFAGLALAGVEHTLTQLMGRDLGTQVTADLAMALDHDITFEQNAMVYAVAHGRATKAEFLEEFGHRCPGEMELAEPRYREDPSYIEQLAGQMAAGVGTDPAQIHQRNLRKRRQGEERLPQLLEEWGGSCFREQIQADLALAHELLPYRETGKYYLMMGYELIRLAVLELARRWDIGNDVFFLTLAELERFEADREALLESVKKRKVRWQSAQRLDMPNVIDTGPSAAAKQRGEDPPDDLENLGIPPEHESATELAADAVASGIATGAAKIVFDPRKAGDLGTGYILVCPSTDPGWTPLFMRAAGLVVERGGILSHGAIVARDFGIPAVVCADATRKIQPDQRVRVDGNSGRITILPTDDRAGANPSPPGQPEGRT